MRSCHKVPHSAPSRCEELCPHSPKRTCLRNCPAVTTEHHLAVSALPVENVRPMRIREAERLDHEQLNESNGVPDIVSNFPVCRALREEARTPGERDVGSLCEARGVEKVCAKGGGSDSKVALCDDHDRNAPKAHTPPEAGERGMTMRNATRFWPLINLPLCKCSQ
ncbi:hypothetical protein BDY21DRAFT_84529 [Lineolata rhizophorae]|uniref:Uncharacterized protein n=1 Tax=Lineolata rhizophorae TaxID=578093 RepID=A0A6A6PBP5_9PEZI|nr:hypothetical protein BDY21DRAFT_84529 [Lineolata rhizophorae]